MVSILWEFEVFFLKQGQMVEKNLTRAEGWESFAGSIKTSVLYAITIIAILFWIQYLWHQNYKPAALREHWP